MEGAFSHFSIRRMNFNRYLHTRICTCSYVYPNLWNRLSLLLHPTRSRVCWKSILWSKEKAIGPRYLPGKITGAKCTKSWLRRCWPREILLRDRATSSSRNSWFCFPGSTGHAYNCLLKRASVRLTRSIPGNILCLPNKIRTCRNSVHQLLEKSSIFHPAI